MSISIEWLANLPVEEQEKFLSQLSKMDDELSPLEVNGVIYHIPSEVNELIDSLWEQLQGKSPVPAE